MDVKYLVQNKQRLIKLKKASLKTADVIELSPVKSGAATKQDGNQDTETTLFRSIVGNTYNWMDSHDDVHVKGCFTKSIKETGEQVLHLHDHVHQLTAEVGDNLKTYEAEMAWKDLGVERSGVTTALMMDTAIQKDYNDKIFSKYESGRIQQHSVGMQYVKIELAINDAEEKEEFEVWNKYIDRIANREKAEDRGYFWAVTEAKLIEVSCVIRGSNEITPTLEPKADDIELAADLIEGNASKENILHICTSLLKGEPLTALEQQEPKPNEAEKHEADRKNYFKNLLNT